MMSRCYHPNNHRYKDYGGRGIRVCPEWRVFANFQKWCLSNFEKGKTVDRINNDGPYSPKNCRWSTPSQQQYNRRNGTPAQQKGKWARVRASQYNRHLKFGAPKKRTIKYCPACEVFMELTEFKPIPANKADGLDGYCRGCRRVYDRIYARKRRASSKI